jgi:regulator of protease activity HflC (stomatin/prohibitin superfamily)
MNLGRANTLFGTASFVALVIFVVAFGSFYTVDEGERGVVTRYGKIVKISQPGLGFKLPLLDSVTKISIQDHVEIYSDMEAYSRDQQPAMMRVSVSYRLLSDKVGDVYRIYGDRRGVIDRLLSRKVMEESKTVFGRFNAESAIRERGRLNSEFREAIQAGVQSTEDVPILILGVQIEDISFSKAYERSVEERMLAEVAVQREKQNLEREKVQADIVRTQALAEADKVRFAAQAEADAIRARGNAEAEAITARAEALKNNAALIELVKAERWNGVLPTTMLPTGSVPFIDVKTR